MLLPPPRGRLRCAFFDFDGTLSLLREGWQDVMAPYCAEVLVSQAGGTSEDALAQVEEMIAQTTGEQTIRQMERLAQMCGLGEGGAATRESALGFKHAYLERLMQRVLKRRQLLESNPGVARRFLLPGARLFLALLRQAGVRCFLFSGTDREDVVAEAELLGLAEFFEEIWGASDLDANYSKRYVLQQMIARHTLRGQDMLVIGDGPVELREGRAVGAVTIAVASDERRGRGWSFEKRRRLLQARPHLLIPDFSDATQLAQYVLGLPRQP